MLIVISPAKSLDYETPANTPHFTQPDYLKQSRQLIKTLRGYDQKAIGKLMGLSDKLSELNYERYQSWKTPFTPKNAKQAALAFKGDVYIGLEAEELTEKQMAWAQDHLRILSGLYGLLRPLDLVQPYRLEMGTKLATGKDASNLYQFWGNTLTDGINQQLQDTGSKILVNLASNEYFKSIRPKQLNAEVITPVFKDLKNGQYKMISFFAKKARGMMSQWIIKKQVKTAVKLKSFNSAGYQFNPGLSTANELVFTRDEAQ